MTTPLLVHLSVLVKIIANNSLNISCTIILIIEHIACFYVGQSPWTTLAITLQKKDNHNNRFVIKLRYQLISFMM